MHFILDGYNMMMRLPELFKGKVPFEPSREGFVNFLSKYRPQGSVRNRVTLVFDGYAEMKMSWSRLRQEGIEVLFSEEESADDRMIRLLKKVDRPGEVVVVTDDRELALRAKGLKAKVVSVVAFVAKLLEKSKKISKDPDEKKKLTPEEERTITEEFRRLWVK